LPQMHRLPIYQSLHHVPFVPEVAARARDDCAKQSQARFHRISRVRRFVMRLRWQATPSSPQDGSVRLAGRSGRCGRARSRRRFHRKRFRGRGSFSQPITKSHVILIPPQREKNLAKAHGITLDKLGDALCLWKVTRRLRGSG
jgi:hypothetical protein